MLPDKSGLAARLAACSALVLVGCATVGQFPDSDFSPPVPRPAYEPGSGPVILIDEGHANFHTVEGRYRPFAELLRRDGYVVRKNDLRLSPEGLTRADIFVISNALAQIDTRRPWNLPTHPAFSEGEITALRDWVAAGGALLLIADHMPFPGATAELAAAFGVYMKNGFAFNEEGESRLVFRRLDGTLVNHPILEGRDSSERIDEVKTFTGQAFRSHPYRDDIELRPLFVLPERSEVRLPRKFFKFSDKTPSIPAAGLLQGATLLYGKGRIAVFGEAAMFSAQVRLVRGERLLSGMNAPGAEQNAQFLLNVMHWLSGLLDGPSGARPPGARAQDARRDMPPGDG